MLSHPCRESALSACISDFRIVYPFHGGVERLVIRRLAGPATTAVRVSLALLLSFVAIAQSMFAQQPQGLLTFASSRSGRFQIYQIQTNPVANLSLVANGGSGNQESRSPTWSSLGRIAYQFGAPGVRGIHSIKPDGTTDRNLTSLSGDERDPSWSPDGRFIVYAYQKTGATDYDLWIHDTNGTPDNTADDSDYALGVLIGAKTQELRPSWAPNGNSIAFVTNVGGVVGTGSNSKIAVVPVGLVNGMIQARGSYILLTDDIYTSFDPTWSPDSKFIAFSTTMNGNRDIYRMSTVGESDAFNFARLTTVAADNNNPAWSPDGTLIAFITNRGGNYDVYLMSATLGDSATADLANVTNDPSDDEDPAWKPESISLLDPVDLSSSLLVNGQITTDVNILATNGIQVIGIAADGAARLVLRYNASSAGIANFFLVDSNRQPLTASKENGQIQDLQGGQIGNSVVVSTASINQGNEAFAVFVAPSQFVRSSVPADQSAKQRQVFLDVQFTPTGGQQTDAGTTPVTLIRPMLFLVHGIWSDPDTWKKFAPFFPVGSPTADPRYYVQRADYSSLSDRGFSTTAPVVYDELTSYLRLFKQDNNVAAVQADVVTHSMGGPVVRWMSLQPNFLNDPVFPTFGAGPVRKLITIAGVHEGTPIADFISTASCLQGIFLRIKKNTSNGAVADLSPSSTAISFINVFSTPFQAHTIVGLADPGAIQAVQDWFNFAGNVYCPRQWIPMNLSTIYQGRRNDLLVSDVSQTGFATFQTATDTVQSVVHSSPFDTLSMGFGLPGNPYETESPAVASLVVQLLDIDTSDGIFWHALPQ